MVHHYSLPLALVAVVACIDGLRKKPNETSGAIPSGCCAGPWPLWLALAKPWFFSGPYLTRVPQLQGVSMRPRL